MSGNLYYLLKRIQRGCDIYEKQDRFVCTVAFIGKSGTV